MRFRWLLLIVLVLAGCGQPLQINTPSARATSAASSAPAASPAQRPTPASSPGAPLQGTPTPGIIEQPGGTAATPVTLPADGTSIVVVPNTAVPLDNQQRWRAQQIGRQPFPERRVYYAAQPVPLLWFDPLNNQIVEIGTIIGDVTVQAQFTLRQTQQPALEVPYRINNDFGLTAISEAIRERMRAAGYTESVETYISQTEAVAPKP